ncbi:MAG: hypothetical protein R6U25_08325, partial [Alkalispirochaeta sp.]
MQHGGILSGATITGEAVEARSRRPVGLSGAGAEPELERSLSWSGAGAGAGAEAEPSRGWDRLLSPS